LDLSGVTALVLGGTGPVGQRVARLLARQGAEVRVGSRDLAKSADVCQRLAKQVSGAKLQPVQTASPDGLSAALEGAAVVVAAGAPGVVLLPSAARMVSKSLKLAIDLNAVPPYGIEGIDVGDKAADRDGVITYGAIGVGGIKMKIHTRAIQRLFESNDAVLDVEEIHRLGLELAGRS
jgi:saccharopine dehydrogenase-like NADP-dependent oxidoreductase